MQSYLVVGETKEERFKQAEKVSSIKYKVSSIDKIVLEDENVQSIGINQIRHLQHQLQLKPYSSGKKVAIIPEAEKLTIPAQNAMLKLLEEPPKDTIIILSSPTSEVLLPTVVSRCRIVKLPDKPQKEIDQKIFNSQFSILNKILKAGVGERIKMADEVAKNRDDAIKFCQIQLLIWRKKMLKTRQEKKDKRHVKIIREIQKALAMLEANTNPKLTIESLLLNYP